MGINAAIEHTPVERERMLAKMRGARDLFYFLAVDVGHHQFVEFAGMLGEYIIMCEAAHRHGVDFATGGRLPMRAHHAAYLAEKLDCIYGAAFAADDNLRNVFVRHFLGAR